MRAKLITLLFLAISYNYGFACKCPQTSVTRHLDKAYDFVIAKVVDEKQVQVSCDGEFQMDYSFQLEVEFSYKDQLSGVQEIFGGKGGGTCGAMMEKGYTYLIVVLKCDHGFYSTMCTATDLVQNSSSEIKILNTHFGKDYSDKGYFDKEFSNALILTGASVIVLASGSIIVLMSYRRRLGKKAKGHQ